MNLASAHLITAMVTPFDDQQHIDFHRLEQLIEHLLATGTDGLLVGGTTGEGPTLSIAEKRDLYTQTARIVAGRVPIIANRGPMTLPPQFISPTLSVKSRASTPPSSLSRLITNPTKPG